MIMWWHVHCRGDSPRFSWSVQPSTQNPDHLRHWHKYIQAPIRFPPQCRHEPSTSFPRVPATKFSFVPNLLGLTWTSEHGTSTTLALDILGHIADVLAAYPHILKNLCLTCKFMVPICRRHLFSNIRFAKNYLDPEYWTPRHEFFLSHPIILTHYVKNLKLFFDNNKAFTPLEYDYCR